MYRRFKTFDPQPEVEVRLGESVNLTDKAKLSLYKKSQNSGIPTSVLEEVYRRGYSIWDESFGGSAEQFGFDRVNSFIAGGFAMDLDEDLLDEKRGLWDNIHTKRARIKAGSGEHMRKPGSKGAPTAADFKASQNEEHADTVKESKFRTGETAEHQNTDSTNPHSRFDGTDSMRKVYAGSTPGEPEYNKNTVGEKAPSNKDLRLSRLANTVKKTVREALEEAKYHGKEVPLNKPMKGDVKKSKVFVKDPSTGNVKKVNFGDPNMSIKKDQPARKKSYCARSSGQGNLSKKTSANYWSRRAWNCEETGSNNGDSVE